MSVDNQSAGDLGLTKTGKPRIYWAAIRQEYENGTIGLRKLAKANGISPSTMMQRSMREKWQRHDKLVRKTSQAIALEVDAKVKRRIEADLAPWIEAEKVKFTQAGVRLAKTGLKRVKRMMTNGHVEPEAKSEAFISKSAETYHRIGRVALGMTDGSAVTPVLSFQVLANHSAIQIVAPKSDQSQD